MVRFGILGPGRIANKFADACGQLEGVTVAVAASRSLARAQEFAAAHGIERAYGSYGELLADESVDAVYIAAVNTAHLELVRRSLEAGKAVLCEKPMGMSYEETAEMCALAQQKGLLLMEATWSQFLPCMKKAHEWVDSGRIGALRMLEDRFAIYRGRDPESRLFDPAVGGGTALDLGPYTVSFLLEFAGGAVTQVHAESVWGPTGVDETNFLLLRFDNGVVGSGISSFQAGTGDDAWIYGESGKIRLEHFGKCRKVELQDWNGDLLEVFEDPAENGFVYEVKAFCQALAEGWTEVPQMRHSFSLECAKIIDAMRRREQEG